MRKILLTILKYLVLFGGTGALLWFAWGKIEPPSGMTKTDVLVNAWNSSNKFYLILCVVIGLLSHWVRAARWRILLRPFGYDFSVWHGFLAVMTGYFVNLGVPRGGEIARCYGLYDMDGVPVDTSIGTVVAERVVDLIFMIIFIGIAFTIEVTRVDVWQILATFSMEETTSNEPSYTKYYILGFFALIVVGFITYRMLFPEKSKGIWEKIKGVLSRIKDGALVIFKLEKKMAFFGYSWLIWICYCLMTFTVMQAFKETNEVGPLAGVTVFTTGGIAMTLPLPGGTGTYHVLVSFVMENFYQIKNAMTFAFIFHAWQTIVIIVVGAFSFIVIPFLGNKRKNNRAKTEEDPVTGKTEQVTTQSDSGEVNPVTST